MNFLELDAQMEERTFPLQTIQSMAERWNKSRQNVAMWAQRDPHFPKPLDGIIEKTSKTPRVYPLYEVERFEQEKGLVKFSTAENWGELK